MKSNKLSLSIVIPCADDIRIKDCLDSIDENVEVIVVLNGPSTRVVEIVSRYDVIKVTMPERNLAKALNVGIKSAKNREVILIDSDCTFQKGAIRKFLDGWGNHYVAKGKVIFKGNSFLSKIVAKARDYVYYDIPKPYNPFLGIRKDIKKYINGFYFDEAIHWTEDADLNMRLKKAGIKVNYVFSAVAFHPPLTLGHDLRSAFRYGIGKRIRVEKEVASGVGTDFKEVLDVAIKKGLLTGLYYIVWNCFYLFGYLYQMIKDPYKVRPLLIGRK